MTTTLEATKAVKHAALAIATLGVCAPVVCFGCLATTECQCDMAALPEHSNTDARWVRALASNASDTVPHFTPPWLPQEYCKPDFAIPARVLACLDDAEVAAILDGNK